MTVNNKGLNITYEAARCLMCTDAPCSAACQKGLNPAAAVRAVRFENSAAAGGFINKNSCAECAAPCESACLHYDFPIRIKQIASRLDKHKKSAEADLSIDFCGVRCENPFFLSSSIIASNYDMVARAFDMGWGGAVFKTIGFYKPKEVSPRFDATSKESTEFIGFKNLEQISDHSVEENMDFIRRLKRDYPSKVIIASIMGQTEDEWEQLAGLCEEANADIIECNFSCPQMAVKGMGSDVGQNPALVKSYSAATRRGTKLPILAKMTPNIGNMEPPAIAAVEGGADGIAAINTIKCITAIDVDTKVSFPDVSGKCAVSGYSGKAVKPIALRFINDMAKCPELSGVPLSGIGGIENWHDALEFIMLGCENVQITTAVMQYGYRIIDDLISGLSGYMEKSGVKHLSELVGCALPNMLSADELDRDSIVYPTFDRNKCVGCGRCYISCLDAGHQALSFDSGSRRVTLIAKNCEGCHLCRLVCPTKAIGISKRIHNI